jgi:hypothetical protein
MKTIPFMLLVLALSYTELAAQKPQRQILMDFRVQRRSAPLKIPLATQKTVLAKVFRKYLTDENQCNPQFDASGSTDSLQAARDAGQIVPSIVDMAEGSFTAAGRTETLYVISVSECNASHADNFGTKRAAIFSGQRLIADVDVDFRINIVRQPDLDGDGLNELLMTSGDMAQGTITEMAVLLEFRNRRLRVIEDFGTVTLDSCASGFPGSSAKASVISIATAPGKMGRMKVDNYVAPCRARKRWRFLSTGKMPD